VGASRREYAGRCRGVVACPQQQEIGTNGAIMRNTKRISATLEIMVAAGAIADFELTGLETNIGVQVWAPENSSDAHLRKHVVTMLGGDVREQDVVVVDA